MTESNRYSRSEAEARIRGAFPHISSISDDKLNELADLLLIDVIPEPKIGQYLHDNGSIVQLYKRGSVPDIIMNANDSVWANENQGFLTPATTVPNNAPQKITYEVAEKIWKKATWDPEYPVGPNERWENFDSLRKSDTRQAMQEAVRWVLTGKI